MAVVIERIYVCRCGSENTKARPRKGLVEITCQDCGAVAETLPPR